MAISTSVSDHVSSMITIKDVLAREREIAFCTVAMKLGKPLAFGFFPKNGQRIPHTGLPGNPANSMVAFELFGRPAILKMMGKTDFRRPVIRAVSEERITNCGDSRAFFACCIVTERDGRLCQADLGAGIRDADLDDAGERADCDSGRHRCRRARR